MRAVGGERPGEGLYERLKPVARRSQNASETSKTGQGRFGDVLCMHDGDHRSLNGNRRRTLDALRYWLPRWRDLGLEFVTIDQAVSPPAA